jgi:hypothetical protein
VVALLLIWSGVSEAYDTFLEDVKHFRLRAGHGVVLLGLVNLFTSLPLVIDGLERWLRYLDAKGAQQSGSKDAEAGEKATNPGART